MIAVFHILSLRATILFCGEAIHKIKTGLPSRHCLLAMTMLILSFSNFSFANENNTQILGLEDIYAQCSELEFQITNCKKFRNCDDFIDNMAELFLQKFYGECDEIIYNKAFPYLKELAMKNKKAKKLFCSKDFESVLDGVYSEEYHGDPENTGYEQIVCYKNPRYITKVGTEQ